MQHPSSLPPTDIFPLTSESVAALQVPENRNHHYPSMDWVKVRVLGADIDYEHRVGFVYNLYLEYAAGETLLDVIRRRGGKLSEPEVQHYTRLILKGLCSIHEKDFGLTKEPNETLDPNCYKFRLRGAPIYMSPKSVAFSEIDTTLDIWSLGCIVVDMFIGRTNMQWMNEKTIMYELAKLKKTRIIPENMSDKGKVFLMKCFSAYPKEQWTAKKLLEHPFIVNEIMSESQVIQEKPSLLLPSMCYPELGFVCKV
ncbi:hypothetical protein Patl1_37078 [Pistacia atlantica]|nr:hypothetical protein Patl1_37078 [Pistacia atlantica]